MPPASFSGAAGGAACGDLVRIDLALARRPRRRGRLRGVGLRRGGRGGLGGGRARPRRARARRGAHRRGGDRGGAGRALAGQAARGRAGRRRAPRRAGRRGRRHGRARARPGAHARGDERRGRLRGGGAARGARGPRGGGGDARALARRGQRRRGLVLLGARRAARALRRAPDGAPALHARPARGVRRRASSRRSSPTTPPGSRPNPCVRCNGDVRLDAMLAFAGRLGAADLATGHYARVSDDGLLRAAADPAKDQSYMLAGLAPASVARMRFPLGGLRKPEVRELARAAGLPGGRQARVPGPVLPRRHRQARVPRAPRRPARAARRDRRPARPRSSASTTASTCSRSASARGSASRRRSPLFVLRKDAAANTVVVGPREALATTRGRGPRRGPAPARASRSTA